MYIPLSTGQGTIALTNIPGKTVVGDVGKRKISVALLALNETTLYIICAQPQSNVSQGQGNRFRVAKSRHVPRNS
uniref:Uncharacterized protein n=1 Tax=Arion vulgaris TaxID=1028688 RepID=A0A0B7BI89_9EUPU